MISVNETGLSVFNEMLDFANEMNVEIHEQKNGSTVIDAGVSVAGGYEAGLYLSRICLADLAELEYTTFDLGGIMVPAIRVNTDHPIVACMASQYAGWRISVGKYFAMGSGPARALSLNPKKLYAEINYKDSYSDAVLVLNLISCRLRRSLKKSQKTAALIQPIFILWLLLLLLLQGQCRYLPVSLRLASIRWNLLVLISTP